MSPRGPLALTVARALAVVVASGAVASLSCGQPASPLDPSPAAGVASTQSPAPTAARERSTTARPRSPSRTSIDGRAFPDKVIALTWDDGPDANTLKLATYLASHRISGTFFVVNAWNHDTSAEPGVGRDVLRTGYEHLPILGDLVALGHRVGNHTLNHVLLSGADAATVSAQLLQNQYGIEPFLTSELRLFRAPGGAFTTADEQAIDGDAALRTLLGPVAWDIDRKDWEGSLWCASTRPALECERSPLAGHLRVKPSVVAARYVATIDAIGHGVVLLHDRVGHVGSDYALDVARALVPELVARGYVFVAPVLAFSPVSLRLAAGLDDGIEGRARELDFDADTLRLGDVDGDGRADVCGFPEGSADYVCALSFSRAGTESERSPRAMFRDPRPWASGRAGELGAARDRPRPHGSPDLADVDGDGRADLCVRGEAGISCALASDGSRFGTFEPWSMPRAGAPQNVADFSDAEGWASGESYFKTVRFADIDGDGKADVCGRAPSGVVCARSLGTSFERARLWLADLSDERGFLPPAYGATMQLGDVNGDGRADVCARQRDGVVCALSTGTSFARATRWSAGRDFSDEDDARAPWSRGPAYYGTLRLGDLNGDGRADLCGRTSTGVVCALSSGRGFTRATTWLAGEVTDAQGFDAPSRSESLRLADINGDGRVDLCAETRQGVECGLAP